VVSFIAAEKTNYPVAVMCRVFGVNRTGFHNWERRPQSDRALQDAWLTEKIKQIHDASRGVYGAPRIHAELRMEHNIRVGRKRVARLMKAAGISVTRRFASLARRFVTWCGRAYSSWMLLTVPSSQGCPVKSSAISARLRASSLSRGSWIPGGSWRSRQTPSSGADGSPAIDTTTHAPRRKR
jgi:hypothetical protein